MSKKPSRENRISREGESHNNSRCRYGWTVMVPFIHGCGVQWKVNVPAVLNVKLQVSLVFNTPESNEPLSAVTV